MFKRELKVNLKSFLIWMIVTLAMFLFVFLMYPSIVNSENIKLIDQMMEVFPKELLIAFNMDIASMDSAYGWLKSEGFVFILLIVGCYSGIMGSTVLLKEESDKTIEYLNSLPVKRNHIVISKVLASLVYISSMIIILAIFNFIGLEISGDFDRKQYILLSLTPFLSCFVIFFVCMFISTFTHKTKKMLGVSFGIVLISYLLQVLSQIADTVEFLKYFSIFTLSNIREVILSSSISYLVVIISICLSGVFLLLTLYRYNKKELL